MRFFLFFLCLIIVVMVLRFWVRIIDIECKGFFLGIMSVDVVKGVLDYFKIEFFEYKVVFV